MEQMISMILLARVPVPVLPSLVGDGGNVLVGIIDANMAAFSVTYTPH